MIDVWQNTLVAQVHMTKHHQKGYMWLSSYHLTCIALVSTAADGHADLQMTWSHIWWWLNSWLFFPCCHYQLVIQYSSVWHEPQVRLHLIDLSLQLTTDLCEGVSEMISGWVGHKFFFGWMLHIPMVNIFKRAPHILLCPCVWFSLKRTTE